MSDASGAHVMSTSDQENLSTIAEGLSEVGVSPKTWLYKLMRLLQFAELQDGVKLTIQVEWTDGEKETQSPGEFDPNELEGPVQ